MDLEVRVEVSEDPERLAARAADLVVGAAHDGLARNGRFCLAVSGGRTPAAMFVHLARADLAWDRVHVFQVDERVAPDGDPGRNLTALRRELLDRVPAQAHLMDVTAADPDAAAAAYAVELDAVCSGTLDLVHLGLGADGHTASWPPGEPVVTAAGDVALAGPYAGFRRMTLTPQAVNRAASIFFLVSGADKRDALAGLRRGDPALPASRVRPGALVLADRPAADTAG